MKAFKSLKVEIQHIQHQMTKDKMNKFSKVFTARILKDSLFEAGKK